MPHQRYEPWKQDWILRLRRFTWEADDSITLPFRQRLGGNEIHPVVVKRSRGGCLQQRDVHGGNADQDADKDRSRYGERESFFRRIV